MKRSHIQRTLGKKCPECGGRLRIILRAEIINGVEYGKSFVECERCFYKELYRDLKNKGRLI